MVLQEKGSQMLLVQTAKPAQRIWMIGIAAALPAIPGIYGAYLSLQGEEFWPWAIASFTMYGIEIAFMIVAAIQYSRQPSKVRERDFYRRRQELRRANSR